MLKNLLSKSIVFVCFASALSLAVLSASAEEVACTQKSTTNYGPGLLFSLQADKNSRASYLFGTLHRSSGEQILSVPVLRHLKEVEVYYQETIFSEQESSEFAEELRFLKPGKSLKNILSATTLTKLDRYLQTQLPHFSDQDRAIVYRFTPNAIVSKITSPELDQDHLSLDQQLNYQVKQRNLPVKGLETWRDHLAGLRSISDQEWDSYVNEALSQSDCKGCKNAIKAFYRCALDAMKSGDFSDYQAMFARHYQQFPAQLGSVDV